MNTYEAYKLVCERLNPEQIIQLHILEKNLGREYAPWEIVKSFKLEPSGEMKPRKRRMSDEVSDNGIDQ